MAILKNLIEEATLLDTETSRIKYLSATPKS